MEQKRFEILSQERLAPQVFRLILAGDVSGITAPGQFVNLSLPGHYLRRPLSVCDWEGGAAGRLTLIYKAVGAGTETLSRLPAGTGLELLTGLGNGYDLSKAGKRPLLAGGGVGIPPLYGLAKRLAGQGVKSAAVLGFNTAAECFLAEEFRALGAEVTVCTADGSSGVRGLVTDGMALADGYSYVYACGPLPMLRAVAERADSSGQFSFEERMGCGFGACMGCTHDTASGPKRLCREGPVLEKEEILWRT